MIRRATLLWIVITVIGGSLLFAVTHETQGKVRALENLNRAIIEDQKALQVLRAEWAYLNQPDRLQNLAAHHLGLEPIPAERIVRLDFLPVRPPANADTTADNRRPPDGTKGGAKAMPPGSVAGFRPDRTPQPVSHRSKR